MLVFRHLFRWFANRRFDDGSISVLAVMGAVPLLALGAVLADSGRTLAERLALQSAVEAAALSGAYEQLAGGSGCSNAATDVAAAVSVTPTVNCNATSSVVTVEASAVRQLTFGELFGRSDATISASASAVSGGVTALQGVRPLALCAEHPGFQQWVDSGYTDTTSHRVNVESDGTQCAGQVPGNWGMLDLDGGANSNADTQEWITNGFPGEIHASSTLDGDPGIPTPAISIDDVLGVPITIPVFSGVTMNGQAASYTVVGFVGLVVESAVLNGPASERHVIVRFTTDPGDSIQRGCCVGIGEVNGGITGARICSLDEMGAC